MAAKNKGVTKKAVRSGEGIANKMKGPRARFDAFKKARDAMEDHVRLRRVDNEVFLHGELIKETNRLLSIVGEHHLSLGRSLLDLATKIIEQLDAVDRRVTSLEKRAKLANRVKQKIPSRAIAPTLKEVATNLHEMQKLSALLDLWFGS